MQIKFLKNILQRIIPEKEIWTWVGTAEGRCKHIKDNKEYYSNSYWNLYVSNKGHRKSEFTPYSTDKFYQSLYESSHVKYTENAVKRWISGGPLPELFEQPEQKTTAKLYSIDGGKQDG